MLQIEKWDFQYILPPMLEKILKIKIYFATKGLSFAYEQI